MREIEIFKNVVITKAAEPLEYLTPDEDRLTAKETTRTCASAFSQESRSCSEKLRQIHNAAADHTLVSQR